MTAIQPILHNPKDTLHWLKGGPGLEWLLFVGIKGKKVEPEHSLQQKAKGSHYRKKGGTWQSTGLDESLQKKLEVCCRKVSGTDHPILLGLFILQH